MNLKKYEDFVPKTDSGKLEWAKNFLISIRKSVAETPQMYYNNKEITELEEEIVIYIKALEDAAIKKNESKAANSLKRVLERKTIRRMRTMALLLKRNGANESIIARLDIRCKEQRVDESLLKPALKAKVVGDVVELHFHKNHLFNVSFYCRFPGQEWAPVGYGFDSPYLDKRPLAVPLQPERREYMGRYASTLAELGQFSDIVSVVFGG